MGPEEARTPADRGQDVAAVAASEEPAPAVVSPYRPRFGFVLGALLGVAIAAVAVAALIAARAADDGVPAGWSAWKPSSDERLTAAKEIAEHVGPKYRLGDGDQLVAVQSGALEVAEPAAQRRAAHVRQRRRHRDHRGHRRHVHAQRPRPARLDPRR